VPHTDEEGEPWTFATDSTGDLELDSNNRLRTVRGDQATVQDLKVALASYSESEIGDTDGDDPRDPEFGLDVFAATRSMRALRREIPKTLEYDDYRHDRVTAIRNIRIIRESGRSFAVQATISLAAQPDDITLIFDLFSNSLAIRGEIE